jgi:hypothetical protein
MNAPNNIVPLHRGITTIERSYARQGRQFSDQQEVERDLRQHDPYGQLGPIDLRVNQLKLRVHPDWQQLVRSFCIAVAVFCIVYFGGQELFR